MLKSEVKRNIDRTINDIMASVEPKAQVDLKHIKDELIYLNIYILYQVLLNRFKSHSGEIVRYFKKELEQFLKGQKSGEFALISMANINNAIMDYIKQYGNIFANAKNHSSGLKQFIGYISKRVWGIWGSGSLYVSMHMMNYYGTRVVGLTKLINDTIELNSEE